MLALIYLFVSIGLGLATAAMGRVVWHGPPSNVEQPVRAWLGRIAVLFILMAATGMAAYLYKEARGPTAFDLLSMEAPAE